MVEIGGVRVTLQYDGAEADEHIVDMYDVSQALLAFQRSLALTTHLVLNGEIITQAPSLKGARIYSMPPEAGSWKTTAVIAALGTGIYSIGTVQNNTPLGHLIFSLYDYVISESLGVHVDYNKSLGQLVEESRRANSKLPALREPQADSLIEKCSTAIREMHRPLYKTHTATTGVITGNVAGGIVPLQTKLTLQTYDYIKETRLGDVPEVLAGRITSYNANTYKGRIYIHEFGRPVSFELTLNAQSNESVRVITTSLQLNATKQGGKPGGLVHVIALKNTSRTGQLKSLFIKRISDVPLQ